MSQEDHTTEARPAVRQIGGESLGRRVAVWLIPLVLIVAGCGYHSAANPPSGGPAGYQWGSLYRQDVRTIAVPIFGTRDFRRDVELSLSKAIVNQIEAQSPYKVVPRDRADTILEGEVVSIEVRRISRDARTALPQEQVITLSVNFTWKDLRTGQILVQRENFDQAATYYPTLGEGEFSGAQDAVERLARAIVQELQAGW